MAEEGFSTENAGVGFGLVIGAGLSTAIGAAAVYNTRLVKLASKPILAAGLGFSGGVMLYVSFVEILFKSIGAFEEAGESEEAAYFYGTLCLFSGMLMMRLLALMVHAMDGNHEECHDPPHPAIRSNVMGDSDVQVDTSGQPVSPADVVPPSKEVKDKRLGRMGLKTAAAISIHNFPEGLATFVATLADPSVGATLAIAIAIHNIPEGLCVALPIYYAGGSRHRAFLWALISGISEPIGALIGFGIIEATGDDMNQTVYGVLFGLVAGMMVMIVMLELIPTGFRYDPEDKYVSNSLVVGMLVMAASLCLFLL